ncbi:regulator [Streptomyces sp. H39-C1]|uniref:regulator n=1 Tax=Streptomyces sp. H39-C1 TaxID=3004355 RepID=UPI0022AEB970|nr:regulator [Streptomyces sp. H39-C1]MCZ4102377.1 regulator [Streptomyces sp. H39-C1]
MTATFTPPELRKVLDVLSSSAVIRLITEIDDNGPIPPRRLAGTLPDLSPHQLRQATETARAHGLVQVLPGLGMDLTTSGSALADVYDTAARWARRHSYPTPVCDFTSRLQHTLALLTPLLAVEGLPHGDAIVELALLRAALVQWLTTNPGVALRCELGSVA